MREAAAGAPTAGVLQHSHGGGRASPGAQTAAQQQQQCQAQEQQAMSMGNLHGLPRPE